MESSLGWLIFSPEVSSNSIKNSRANGVKVNSIQGQPGLLSESKMAKETQRNFVLKKQATNIKS